MDKREGELSKFSVEKFLSQSAKKGRGGTLKSFFKFGYREKLCFRGICHNITSKTFCLTVPKHFVEEPFYAVFWKKSGSEKVYGYKRVGVSKFSVESFLSQGVEKYRSAAL